MIDPAEEVEKYLGNGSGKLLSEIIRDIQEFVAERDKWEGKSGYKPYRQERDSYVREGRTIPREKLNE